MAAESEERVRVVEELEDEERSNQMNLMMMRERRRQVNAPNPTLYIINAKPDEFDDDEGAKAPGQYSKSYTLYHQP